MAMSRKNRLRCMLALTVAMFLAELIVGHWVRSLSLVADSFHLLSDGLSLLVALYALHLTERKTWTVQFTYGWQRAEVVGGLVNGVFLFALCINVILESIERFFQPTPVEKPLLVLIVGGVGLVVNALGLVLFREHAHMHHGHEHSHTSRTPSPTVAAPLTTINISSSSADPSVDVKDSAPSSTHQDSHSHSINLHAVFLHLLGDTLGSVAVMIAASVMEWTTWEQRWLIDPLLSLLISFVLLYTTLPLLRHTTVILLQGLPASTSFDLDRLRDSILAVEGVQDIHELHVWQLSDTKRVASVHVVCTQSTDFMCVAKELKQLLHQCGIHSVTVQPEFLPPSPSESVASEGTDSCLLRCHSDVCQPQACCPSDVSVAWSSSHQAGGVNRRSPSTFAN